MSAVLLALFDDYLLAERARVTLVLDGFATDRVDVTACCEPGRAGLLPDVSLRDRFLKHFGTLLGPQEKTPQVAQVTERLLEGQAAVTVHPRGAIETERATQLLISQGSNLLLEHDLTHQRLERAAANRDTPAWFRHLWIESRPDTDCLYCRLQRH